MSFTTDEKNNLFLDFHFIFAGFVKITDNSNSEKIDADQHNLYLFNPL